MMMMLVNLLVVDVDREGKGTICEFLLVLSKKGLGFVLKRLE